MVYLKKGDVLVELKKCGKIAIHRQDGAFAGGYLFSFSGAKCNVYKAVDLSGGDAADLTPVSAFFLDRHEELEAHSNAVMFSNEYYAPGDEFPLLYTNVYNSYAGQEDPMKGVCLVYRILRDGSAFTSTLVQILRISFVEDAELWRSSPEKEDKRPYGNFVIDREAGLLYAFTMRDAFSSTRYFAFRLPKITEGEKDSRFGVNAVTLQKEDILEYFDCPYHRFIQGATCYEGKIYSLEGFSNNGQNQPAIRIIDLAEKRQEAVWKFIDFGLSVEPELIDFWNGVCYYGDNSGELYILTF